MTEETGSEASGNPEAVVETAQATPANWVSSFENTDLASYAEVKGFQNTTPENVVNSYRNLEKLMGADKAGRTVTLLPDDATTDQRNEFYGKLGRPKEAAGYGITAPEGDTTGFADWASGAFHDLGLTSGQASGLVERWGEYSGGHEAKVAAVEQSTRAEAVATLEKNWGAAYEQNVAKVDNYIKQFGMNESQLLGLASAMGKVEAMNFIYDLGQKTGEDPHDTGDAMRTSGALSPAQAKQALGELNMNKEFMDAWLNKSHPGHAAAVEKKAGYARMASGVSA